MASRPGGRRFLVPEVIQTSGMDCGPAALKSLLEGFHIPVSYARLRDACQTGLDGTSIDTLEELARTAGLDARQVMLPQDHVLLRRAQAIPALAVVRNASGGTHFIVVWRRHGSFVQIMDPARGRLWISAASLLNQLVVHTMAVPAAGWRQYAGSDAFLRPFHARLEALGLRAQAARARTAVALSDPGWRPIATLDAATRLVASLVNSNALSKSDAAATLDAMVDAAGQDERAIGDHFWQVRPAPNAGDALMLRGVVLVRASQPADDRSIETAATLSDSPELSAALAEPPASPLGEIVRRTRAMGLLTPAVAGAAMLLAVAATIFEATLLRSAVDIGSLLVRPEQRVVAGIFLTVFAVLILGLEWILAAAERRIGINLEGRLRIALLDKIPSLADAYFQSRPVSDMLERSHTIHTVRLLPKLCVRSTRIGVELLVTAGALTWLNPNLAFAAFAAAGAAALIPIIGQAIASERDLRARTHAGALGRFHLDALHGRTAIDAHGAAATIEREHENLLAEWAASSLALQRASVAIEGLQMLVGFGLAAWMVLAQFSATANPASLLLQVYWLLNLPALGYELALIAREYPTQRSTLLRLLEPLNAPAAPGYESRATAETPSVGIGIAARNLTVAASGRTILQGLDLTIAPGTHVAVLGRSGAGKSTLVGMLLGWHRPAEGELEVDTKPLDGAHLDNVRRQTAWVDPTVQLWNRSLFENLVGATGDAAGVGPVMDATGLLPVVARLPQGMATPLGEGGARLSAGEAQRVRLARALLHPKPRLVILDEPFLGLERDRRRALLTYARQRWSKSTLLYVTHDIAETRAFDRIVVIDDGRIVEDGHPQQLAQQASSKYRRLLQAHEATQARFLASTEWRRLRMDQGRVVQDQSGTNEQTA